MSILKKTARWPRNARCHCGSGKKYKYCCHAQSSEQPILSSKRTNYIDTGESAVRYVISDARGTSFFSSKEGKILVFASKADAFAIATSDVFRDAEPGEINVAGVGQSKWEHIQKELPFIEPTDVVHAETLLKERMEHMREQLAKEEAEE